MKIIVKTNFPFNVQNIGFSSHGELIINLSSDNENPKNSCRQLLKVGGECLFQEKSTALLIGCVKDREWGTTLHFTFFLSSALTVASYF